jgi:hypothetical protein
MFDELIDDSYYLPYPIVNKHFDYAKSGERKEIKNIIYYPVFDSVSDTDYYRFISSNGPHQFIPQWKSRVQFQPQPEQCSCSCEPIDLNQIPTCAIVWRRGSIFMLRQYPFCRDKDNNVVSSAEGMMKPNKNDDEVGEKMPQPFDDVSPPQIGFPSVDVKNSTKKNNFPKF